MNNAEAHALMRRRIAQMNAGDLEGMLEGVHPDVRWQAPPDATGPRVYEGHAGVREFVTDWLEAWGKFEQEVEQIDFRGAWAVARVRFRTRGEASGVEVEAEGGYLMRLEADKLVEMRIFMTYAEAEAAWADLADS